MKKIFLYTAVALLGLSSCRNDNSSNDTVSIESQNTYDDQAITKYLEEYYFDAQGEIVKFSTTDPSDDNYPKLSSYNPVKLPSGVVYIVRPNVQPNPGKSIGSTDIIKIMGVATSYIATNQDNIVKFDNQQTFKNTLIGSGIPENNPYYYYAGKSIRTQFNKDRNFFEIEGFREALQYFKSYEIPDSESYNLQGVIIVPSRAAYARDENVNDAGTVKFKDRSIVFNFQIYQTSDRPNDQL